MRMDLGWMVNTLSLSCAVFCLIWAETGKLDMGPWLNKAVGVLWMGAGVFIVPLSIGHLFGLLSGDDPEPSSFINVIGGLCMFLAGWRMYHKDDSPRRKRRRVRNAIKRLASGRLVPAYSGGMGQ